MTEHTYTRSEVDEILRTEGAALIAGALNEVKSIVKKPRIYDANRGQVGPTLFADEIIAEIDALIPDAARLKCTSLALEERETELNSLRIELDQTRRQLEEFQLVTTKKPEPKRGRFLDLAVANDRIWRLEDEIAAFAERDADTRLEERKLAAFHEYREDCTCFHCRRICELNGGV